MPHDLEAAIAQYRTFGKALLANESSLDGRDEKAVLVVTIHRDEVLECFLTMRPEFAPFQYALAVIFPKKEFAVFVLDAKRWERAKLSA